MCMRKLLLSPIWSTRPTTGCGARSTSLGVHRNFFWQLSRQKLAWFTHVTCRDNLSKTILPGILESRRYRGQYRKCWMDNIKEWTSLCTPELLTRLERLNHRLSQLFSHSINKCQMNVHIRVQGMLNLLMNRALPLLPL